MSALAMHGSWSTTRCGWAWTSVFATQRIMESLLRRGLVVASDEVTKGKFNTVTRRTYTLTKSGKLYANSGARITGQTMKAAEAEQAKVRALVDELLVAVEGHQGYFHVSDGETFATRAELFERIRGRLEHGRKACRLMGRFLKRHGGS